MIGVKYRKFCFFVFFFLLAFGVLTIACTKRSSSPRNKGGEPVGEDVSSSSKGTVEQSEEEKYFDKWVDFVNCYYVHGYLKRKNISVDALDVQDVDHRLSYDTIKVILQKYDWSNEAISNKVNIKALQLAECIEEKKDNYDPDLSPEEIIFLLLNLPDTLPSPERNGFKGYLEIVTPELKCLIVEYYDKKYIKESEEKREKDNPVREGDTIQKKTKTVTDESNSNDDQQPKDGKKSFWWLFTILGFAGGFVVRGLMARKAEKKKLDDASDFYSQEKSKLKEEKRDLQLQIDKISMERDSLKEERDDLLNENIALGKKLDDMKSNSQNNSGDVGKNKQETTGQSSNQHSVLYADAILGDMLVGVKNVPGDDTIYKLRLKSPTVAEFVVYSNAVQRIIANPSFVEGCDKQVLPNATTVEIVSAGKAKKDESSGKWIVTEKLKINIK